MQVRPLVRQLLRKHTQRKTVAKSVDGDGCHHHQEAQVVVRLICWIALTTVIRNEETLVVTFDRLTTSLARLAYGGRNVIVGVANPSTPGFTEPTS